MVGVLHTALQCGPQPRVAVCFERGRAVMTSICGMLKETGYFFKGYVKTRASRSVIQNAMGFMTGIALAAKKTLAGISEAISGQASPDQLRKFLDNA